MNGGIDNGQGTRVSTSSFPGPTSSRREQAADLGRPVIGSDPSLRLVIEMAGTIASTRTPVLIVGERGTGKALLARTIHGLGSRADQPFVTIDCAALTEAHAERERSAGLLSSSRTEPGFDWLSKLTQAQGGTHYLNEVSALSEPLQHLLLRALQDREQDHAQGHYSPHSDVRFLLSTNENLVTLVEQGRFRQDLYHRASVVCLKLPPLRHRGADIEQVAEYFRSRFSLEFGKNVVGFTRDALDILNQHDWPAVVGKHPRAGIRVIQPLRRSGPGTLITSGHLSPSLRHPRTSRSPCVLRRGRMCRSTSAR